MVDTKMGEAVCQVRVDDISLDSQHKCIAGLVRSRNENLLIVQSYFIGAKEGTPLRTLRPDEIPDTVFNHPAFACWSTVGYRRATNAEAVQLLSGALYSYFQPSLGSSQPMFDSHS